MCPIVDGRPPHIDRATLPYLLYLPGIDGTGLAGERRWRRPTSHCGCSTAIWRNCAALR